MAMPKGHQIIPIKERFWSKVKKTKTCWIWTAYKTTNGYGRFGMAAHIGPKAAHRVAWALTHGEIPKGLNVLHKCDNPPCVRPSHLFLGTLKENSQDMKNKLRGTIGESNKHAKLTKNDVLEIRESCAKKELKQYQLAEKYNVSTAAISLIVNRINWTWL